MPRFHFVLSLLCCWCLLGGTALAEDESPYRSVALGGEGDVLEVVPVPEGLGDGRITTRDAYALAEYCAWGWQQSLYLGGLDVALSPEAEDRLILFWDYVWDVLDADTKMVISIADQFWPVVREQWDTGDAAARAALLEEFLLVQDEVWGGLLGETAAYLIGELSPDDYASILDQAMAAMRSSGGGGGVGTFGGSSVEDMINHHPNYEQDYVRGDGSIDYADPS